MRDSSCLNCGHPFFGNEKFCQDCGQANKGNRITFRSFIHEIFNGFFSFDAKFWRTIIPLLTSPGKVSKDYVEGKRSRYSNPFRFYFTISIFFFLILGLSKSIDTFKSLQNGAAPKEDAELSFFDERNNKNTAIDSLLADTIINQKKDSATTININSVTFSGLNLNEFLNYHKKYPNSKIDTALDSLHQEKTFFNRFMYSRAQIMSSVVDKKEAREQFFSQLLSYGSVALFVFLPFFTLFLRLFYVRRKFNYVDHLIFVFHTQTVFFLLLSILSLISIFTDVKYIWIFLGLFLVYLFLAMKKFYNQGYLKTIAKYSILNLVYLFMGGIGVLIVGLISFALY